MQDNLLNTFDMGCVSKDNLSSYDLEQIRALEMMSLETQSVDIQCQIDLEDTDDNNSNYYDLSENYSQEGIAEAIKNKGARAYYAVITMSKKALNYMFGFIVNLFKASTNVKGTLKKVFEKAKKYDKELDKLISKKFPKDFEIESKNYAKRSNASLALIRAIIQMTQDCIAKANEENDDDPISRGIKLSINYSHLISSLTSDDIKIKPEDLLRDISKVEGEVEKLPLINKFRQFISKGYKELVSFFSSSNPNKERNTKKKEAEGQLKNASIKFKFEKDPTDYINIIEKRSEKLEDLVESYKSEPESKTVNVSSLLIYYRNQLKLFLNISYKNNWDYSKSIKQLETLRAKTIKAIDKVHVDREDSGTQKNIQAAMRMMVAMGKSMNSLTPLVKSLLSNITSDIDNLITEIAKVGSKASKVE